MPDKEILSNLPELPTEFTEEDARILKDLQEQQEELRKAYDPKLTREGWDRMSPLERGARHAVAPLDRVPLIGGLVPPLTIDRMREAREEVEAEIAELTRRQYVVDRYPEIKQELINRALTGQPILTPQDLNARFKDLQEMFTTEERDAVANLAYAISKAPFESLIEGSYMDDPGFDYRQFFQLNQLDPNHILSTVAFNKDTEEIRKALNASYPPDPSTFRSNEEVERYISEKERAWYAERDLPYDVDHPALSAGLAANYKLFKEGTPTVLLDEDGTQIPAMYRPPTEGQEVGHLWTPEGEYIGPVNPETGEIQALSSEMLDVTSEEYQAERRSWETEMRYMWMNIVPTTFRAISFAAQSFGISLLDTIRSEYEGNPPVEFLLGLCTKLAEKATGSPTDIFHPDKETRTAAWEAAAKESIYLKRLFDLMGTQDPLSYINKLWGAQDIIDGLDPQIQETQDWLLESMENTHAMMNKFYEEHPELLPGPMYELTLNQYRKAVGAPDKEDPKFYDGIGTTLSDPKFWTYRLMNTAQSMAIMVGLQAATLAVTKNPKIAITVGAGWIGPVEVDRVTTAMLDANIPTKDAAMWNAFLTPVIAGMEMGTQAIVMSAFFPRAWREFTGKVFLKEFISLTQRGLRRKGIQYVTLTNLIETGIEVAVQAVGNVALQIEEVIDDWTVGLTDVAVETMFGFLPTSLIGGGRHYRYLQRGMKASQNFKVTIRSEQLQSMGLSKEQADLKALGEFLATEEGQVVMGEILKELEPITEMERNTDTLLKDMWGLEGEINKATFERKELGNQLKRVNEKVKRRKKELETIRDLQENHSDVIGEYADKLQRRQEKLQNELQILESQQTELTNQRQELAKQIDENREALRSRELEAYHKGLITEGIWDSLSPEARKVYVDKVGLDGEMVSRAWKNLTEHERAVLQSNLREGDVRATPIVEPSEIWNRLAPDTRATLAQEAGIAEVTPALGEEVTFHQLRNRQTDQATVQAEQAKPVSEATALREARRFNKGIRQLSAQDKLLITEYTARELTQDGIELYLSEDGLTGYAIDREGTATYKDKITGEIKPITGEPNQIFNIFNASGVKGRGVQATIEAISKGGNSVFYFEVSQLSNIYQRLGFKPDPSQRYDFDPQQAPPGWEQHPDLQKRPSVVTSYLDAAVPTDVAELRSFYENARKQAKAKEIATNEWANLTSEHQDALNRAILQQEMPIEGTLPELAEIIRYLPQQKELGLDYDTYLNEWGDWEAAPYGDEILFRDGEFTVFSRVDEAGESYFVAMHKTGEFVVDAFEHITTHYDFNRLQNQLYQYLREGHVPVSRKHIGLADMAERSVMVDSGPVPAANIKIEGLNRSAPFATEFLNLLDKIIYDVQKNTRVSIKEIIIDEFNHYLRPDVLGQYRGNTETMILRSADPNYYEASRPLEQVIYHEIAHNLSAQDINSGNFILWGTYDPTFVTWLKEAVETIRTSKDPAIVKLRDGNGFNPASVLYALEPFRTDMKMREENFAQAFAHFMTATRMKDYYGWAPTDLQTRRMVVENFSVDRIRALTLLQREVNEYFNAAEQNHRFVERYELVAEQVKDVQTRAIEAVQRGDPEAVVDIFNEFAITQDISFYIQNIVQGEGTVESMVQSIRNQLDAKLHNIQETRAQFEQLEQDNLKMYEARAEALNRVDRGEIEFPAMTDTKPFNSAKHPQNELGYARQPSFQAQRAKVLASLRDQPNLRNAALRYIELGAVRDGSVNYAKLSGISIGDHGTGYFLNTKETLINMEEVSGLPFLHLYEMIRNSNGQIRNIAKKYIKELTQDRHLISIFKNEHAMARIEQQIEHIRDPERTPRVEDLSDAEQKALGVVQKFFQDFEHKAVILAFESMYRRMENPTVEDFMKRFDLGEEARPDILRAMELTAMGETAKRDQFLSTQRWGLIKGYSPWMIVRNSLAGYEVSLGTVRGEARMKQRSGVEFPQNMRTLTERMYAYMVQMETQWQMREQVQEFTHMLDRVAPKLTDSSQMYDQMGTMLAELQHMMPETANHFWNRIIMRIMRTVTGAVFLSALAITRNSLQGLAFHPYRSEIFRGTRGLPAHLKSQANIAFDVKVSQLKGMQESLLFSGEKTLFSGLPGAENFYRFFTRVHPYGHSDNIPRHMTFNAGMNKAYRAVRGYQKHKNPQKLLRDSGLNILSKAQQRMFLQYVAQDTVNFGIEGLQEVKGVDAAVIYAGQEIADLTHFNYERWQQAPIHHGVQGRVLGSLLTFTRSYWLRHYHNAQRFMDSNNSARDRLASFRDSAALIMSGAIVGAYLEELFGREYRSYWLFDILWSEVGGLALGSINEFMAGFPIVASLIDPMVPEEEKEKQWRSFVKWMRKTSSMSVPLLKNFLQTAEAWKGYDEDVDWVIMERMRGWIDSNYEPEEVEKLEYTLMEAVRKALFNTPLPDPLVIERAQQELPEWEARIGQTNPQTGDIYTLGNYLADVRRLTDGIPLDMISEEEGFSELTQFAVDYLAIERRFNMLPTDDKSREQFRKDHPFYDAMMIFWDRYHKSVHPPQEVLDLLYTWHQEFQINPKVAHRQFTNWRLSQLWEE